MRVAVFLAIACVVRAEYVVTLLHRSADPVLSYIDGQSSFGQIFNPTWVQPSAGTNGVQGLLGRTQNCAADVGGACVWCGGSQDKASVLTFSAFNRDGTFSPITEASVVFGPSDASDSWGTEDPRMQYNEADGLYYMFYTAYNGSAILLNLATSPNPTSPDLWTRHGPVFPSMQGSKSAALLLRDSPPHYLLWGDHDILIAQSDDPTVWPDIGTTLLQVRSDNFDSKLVESGPPPLLLSSGDYLFFYNSAQLGWPDDLTTSYNVGWVILDGNDPTVIKQRSEVPLFSPVMAWEKGDAPYTCNAPNVVFLEAARPLGDDVFEVYFGGADAVIGSAIFEVTY